ncbi:MAG: zinc ribbon domain-containing protein [Planctomycetes bacterium]|nr:zinc ribbon domain-containing protein [Planctomycetota bacterium]
MADAAGETPLPLPSACPGCGAPALPRARYCSECLSPLDAVGHARLVLEEAAVDRFRSLRRLPALVLTPIRATAELIARTHGSPLGAALSEIGLWFMASVALVVLVASASGAFPAPFAVPLLVCIPLEASLIAAAGATMGQGEARFGSLLALFLHLGQMLGFGIGLLELLSVALQWPAAGSTLLGWMGGLYSTWLYGYALTTAAEMRPRQAFLLVVCLRLFARVLFCGVLGPAFV